MIAQAQDKKRYAEEILGMNTPSPSFSPLIPNLLTTKGSEIHEFKYKFIARQIEDAKSSLKLNQTPHSLVRLGDLYLMRGNYKKAVEYFLMAIELKNDFIIAYEKIIIAYLSHREFDQVNKYYFKLIEATGRRSDILHKYAIFKAFIYEHKQNIKEAISILEEVINANPKDFEALNTYGMILMKSGTEEDLNKAKLYFIKSIEIKVDYIHALNNLGVTLMMQKKYKEGIDYLFKAIEINPSYIHGYQNIASLYISEENYKDAYNILIKAKHRQLQLDPVWEHKIGWLLIRLEKTQEALEWYTNKIKEEPNNDLLYNNLGVCFNMLGKNEKAEECFYKAGAIFKSGRPTVVRFDNFKSFHNLGRSAIDKGDIKTLDTVAEDILKMNPNDAFGLYLTGASHTMKEEFLEAKEIFEKVLSIDRKIPEIYPDYGFVLESIERDHKKAIVLLEEAIEYGYKSPLTDNNLAFAYIKNGNLDKAKKILDKYKSDDILGVLLATKGLLEIKKGDLKKGDEYYNKALKVLRGKEFKIASQIWHYERASYLYENKDLENAKLELFKTKEYPKSYVNVDIEELEQKINYN